MGLASASVSVSQNPAETSSESLPNVKVVLRQVTETPRFSNSVENYKILQVNSSF